MRSAYSYIVGFFAALVAAKSCLSQLEGVNLGEDVSLWALSPLLMLVLFFPPNHLVRWGAIASSVTVLVAEGYERSYQSLTGDWLSAEASIISFWVTATAAIIITVTAIRKRQQQE
ncbi:hypothetical protein MK805_11535 [Shimazuella sp. AN120528]|uniref:hypothetical protein n=1 Tax=Shimazuella soli TaxID=1892854 RepID=UPI001F0D4930|nr:hypothetical protein [Shimazuella soli]MCH5585577.1 hypothetical protein [Shimazuella soli]